jgi:hypothetical protein
MAYTTINKSTDYFNTVLYTGNGSTQAVTGVGFQPDWVWLKDRTDGDNHQLYDAVRGVTKSLQSNNTNAEITFSDGLTAFGTDGFTLGSNDQHNGSSDNFASWNWKANGQGSSNTDGSINTTYTSVNTTSGFSISQYTGNGSDGATVGHGLGVSPNVVFVKRLSGGTGGWRVYHSSIHASSGETKTLTLNDTDANASDIDNISGVSATTFTTRGTGATNTSGSNFIAYCFAEKTGFSKFGSYVGNGNADGTFIYTGFKPAFVLLKCSSSTGDWQLIDTKRSTFNVCNLRLQPNSNGAEAGSDTIDILSNGFKQRNTFGNFNTSGATYIYMAFAEAPLVGSNNVPCTAR